MQEMDKQQIKEHTDGCARCRHAKHIGALCKVGRQWIRSRAAQLKREAK